MGKISMKHVYFLRKLHILWNILNQKANKYKQPKYKKEHTRKEFLQRIENAKSCIYMFGLKFPNYFTNENKIYTSLKHLEKKNPNVKVKIFVPDIRVIRKIEKLGIYPHNHNNTRKNIHKLQDFKEDFEKLNIEIIEYHKFIPFGFSAIDIDTNNSFMHISKVKKGEYIKDSEYFSIKNDKNISKIILYIIKN